MRSAEIGIYRFVNNTNGKSYVGRSNDLRHRYTEHISLLRRNAEPCVKLNRAWQKYGEDSFSYEILCYCDESELNEKEVYYISLFDSFKNGYNCTMGGGGIVGYKHTDEAKEKIGRAFRGKPLPEGQKKLLSDLQKGKTLTEEHKQALRDAWTDERKKRLSETRSGENHPNYGRTGKDAYQRSPVICQTGELFYTIREAAKWCGLSSSGNISSCCRGIKAVAGKHPITNEPLKWKYATKDDITKFEAQQC